MNKLSDIARAEEDGTVEINTKLAALARHMARMGENNMGELSEYEASLFHRACDLINRLVESCEAKEDAQK